MSMESRIRIGAVEIPQAEQTPLVLALVDIIRRQEREIQALRDEIHKLKGTTPRPKIEPSRLLQPPRKKEPPSEGQRPGSAKRCKTTGLPVHQEVPLVLGGLPAGTRIEGYRDFVVQHLKIHAHNTR
jgi:hypothetical protein